MKARTVILLAIVAILLVGSVAMAQSGGPRGYVVKGTASGGGYRLTSPGWKFGGAASGGQVLSAGAGGTGGRQVLLHLPAAYPAELLTFGGVP